MANLFDDVSSEKSLKTGLNTDMNYSAQHQGNMFNDVDPRYDPEEGRNQAQPFDAKQETDAEVAKLLKRDRQRVEEHRYGLNQREGFHGNLIGLGISSFESGRGIREHIKDVQDNPTLWKGLPEDYLPKMQAESAKKLAEWKSKRGPELSEFYSLPDWWDKNQRYVGKLGSKDASKDGEKELSGGEDSFVDTLFKMSQSLAGQLVGGAPSPENLMPVGKSKHLFSTFLKGFAANAPAGAFTNLMDQQMNVEAGLQKEIDWDQVLVGGVTGGGLGGGLNMGMHHGSFKPTPKTTPTSSASQAFDEMMKGAPKAKADVLPNLFDEFKTEPGAKELTPEQAALKAEAEAKQPLPDVKTPEPSIDELQAKVLPQEEPKLPTDIPHTEETPPVQYTSELPKIGEQFDPTALPKVEGPDFTVGKTMVENNVDNSQRIFDEAVQRAQAAQEPLPSIEQKSNPDLVSPFEDPALKDALQGFNRKYEVGDKVRLRGDPNDPPKVVKGVIPDRQTGELQYIFAGPDNKPIRINQSELIRAKDGEIRDLILEQLRKKQGGSFDPDAFAEGFKRMFGASKVNSKAFQEKLKASYTEFGSAEELRHYLETNDIVDLKLQGDFVSQNQLAQIAQDNKVVTFVFNKLFDTMRQSDTRMFGYDNVVRDSLKWVKDNVDESVKFFREWENLNARPELAEARAALRAGGDDAIKQYMMQHGVKGSTVDQMLPFSKVMDDLLRADKDSLKVHGRELTDEPFYFPLARKGEYKFLVTDDTGSVRHVGGFDSLRAAKEAAKEFQTRIDKEAPGWGVGEVIQTDTTKMINSAMTDALLQGEPKWLRQVAYDQYTRRIEYQRNFELGRSTEHTVGGYLGQLDPANPKEQRKLLQSYLDAFSHRVRESHHLENASAAVEIAKELLSSDDTLPKNTKAWLHTEISRHIGVDISIAQNNLDKWINTVVQKGGRILTHLDGALNNYEVGLKDNVLSPDLAKALTQGFSYFASLAKIGLSPIVLAGNLAQNVTIGLEGTRNAFRTGISPHHAVVAQIKQLAYFATLGMHDEFKGVKEKMKRAKEEGILDPHGREDYSVVENVDRVKGAATLDKVVQAPRNIIEYATNYNAVLYYHMMADSAFPDMPQHQKDQLVYNWARSFTGDYSQAANMFAFQKAGIVGHLGSNFAKWKFNRTSRYIDDIIMAARPDKYGVRSVLPLFTSIAIGGIMAGAMGSVGLVEYESLRRLGQSIKGSDGKPLWNWKPLSAIYTESGVGDTLGTHQNTMLERGATTAFSDWFAQNYLGEKTGPDFSSSVRESSFLEAPGVATSYLADVVGAGATLLKEVMSSKSYSEYVDGMKEGVGKDLLKKMTEKNTFGVTSDDLKQRARALPNVLQEAYNLKGQAVSSYFGLPERPEIVQKTVGEDGEPRYVTQEATKEEGKYERNKFQEGLALLGGTKTTDENRSMEGRGYLKYLNKDKEGQLTALKDGISNNLESERIVDRNAKLILEEHGEAALQHAIKEIADKHDIKMNADFFTLETMAALKSRDQRAAFKAIERIQRALAVAHRDGISPLLDTSKLSQDEEISRDLGNSVSGTKDRGQTKLNLNQYPTVLAAVPKLRAHEFEGSKGLGGFMRDKDQKDTIFINDKWDPKERTFSALHETEHILQKKGMPSGSPAEINRMFDKLVGDETPSTRLDVVLALTRPEVRQHLKDKYGITDSYFDPKMVEFQGSKAVNLLYEQFASLAAAEHMAGPAVDITKDPELRKTVFDTAAKREAFRAMTGLRQTRLDSKDLPPYTRVTEKQEPTKADRLTSWAKKLLGP